MERNKRRYESPRTESIELRFEGMICQSDPKFRGFNEEEEW